MKNFILLTTLSVLIFAQSGCRRHDFKEHTIKIPEMSNEACARMISDRLSTAYKPQAQEAQPDFEPVKVLSVDMNARTITVKYESLITAKKNLDFIVADLGFDANGTPGNKEAAAKLDPAYGLKVSNIPLAGPVQVPPNELVPIIQVPTPAPVAGSTTNI